MSGPRWTLAAVTYHWADAYLITYTRDRWVALRRDTRKLLSGHTLDELEAAICADYGRRPVPREFDPPETAEEMSWLPIPFLPGPDDCEEEEEEEEEATASYLLGLRGELSPAGVVDRVRRMFRRASPSP